MIGSYTQNMMWYGKEIADKLKIYNEQITSEPTIRQK